MNYRDLFLSIRSKIKSSFTVDRTVSPNLPLWIEIVTSEPECTYYFGSFDSRSEAMNALPGYVEDLEQEKAKGINVEIKPANPQHLTIFNE